MRSLTLVSCRASTLKGKKPEARYTSLAIRPEQTGSTTDNETLYLAAERQLLDGGVEIQIFIANHVENLVNPPIASFRAPPEPPYESFDGKHIINFRYLAETNALVLVLAGGDLLVVSLEDDALPGQEKVEVVGSVESGIRAAEWSPDEELLVIVTGDDNLVEMTKTFDVLAEYPLATEEFGEDAPVDLGWGAQTTQFQGSKGKNAVNSTVVKPTASRTNSSDSGQLERQEDNACRISWRGDGAYFVVSALFKSPQSTANQRKLRFYSRTAILQSTSEPTPLLHGSLAWQPSGSIVASSTKDGNQVIFFEKNGLRRYEFELKEERPEYQSVVRQLVWNLDSTILAVWIERLAAQDSQSKTIVQLWRRNNYHWYLKTSIRPHLEGNSPVEQIYWNTEQPMTLYILSSTGYDRRAFIWDTYTSSRPMPQDSGAVAVVDGKDILLTSFRYQNVPPPMSSLTFSDSLGQTPVHIAFSHTQDTMAALMPDGAINIWNWTLGNCNQKTVRHIGRVQALDKDAGPIPSQIAIINNLRDGIDLHMLCTHPDRHRTLLVSISVAIVDDGLQILEKHKISLSSSIMHIHCSSNTLFLQDAAHQILESDERIVAKFPEYCPRWQPVSASVFVGLSDTGRLFANEQILAIGCSSFGIGGEFLVYTTLQHEIRCVLVQAILSAESKREGLQEEDVHRDPIERANGHMDDKDNEASHSRRVERGSRIVAVVPSSMSVVLQMPRGNLETISPRPLVLQVVRRHIDRKEYREAYLTCRRHRIDLNLLCDHCPEAFKEDLGLFVDQIADTDYLNIFISNLKNIDVTQSIYRSLTPHNALQSSDSTFTNKVNGLCVAMRAVFDLGSMSKYANTILTTYVCQVPADLEAALQLISKIKVMDCALAEDAVKYIIFLADANKLFDVALGMYDFELVLAVAQNSQKDPREYIPFLRQLRTYEKYYQRFKIDDHLKRYDKALSNLSEAGENCFEELLQYMQKHELFDHAVNILSQRPKELLTVLDLRGDWLFKDNRSHEAALSYTLAKQPRKAMIAYQRALIWIDLFDIAHQEQMNADEIAQLAQSMSSSLKGKGRHVEAGRVLLDYGRDVRAAVATLCEGSGFSEALRIASLYSAQHLVHEVIAPMALEEKEQLVNEADEIREQLKKQVERLDILREKRIHQSTSFYGQLSRENGAIDNVDLQTDAGSTVATTQFTRYTAAPVPSQNGTMKSGRSRKTSKTDRKTLKKAAAGAKGSVYEESYLLGSLSRLVVDGGRLAALVAASASLNRVLVRLSARATATEDLPIGTNLREPALLLEETVGKLLHFATDTVDSVWNLLGETELHDLETALLADSHAEHPSANILKRPTKPKFAELGHWKVGLLSLLAD